MPLPPDPAGLFSEGGDATKLHIEGSLMIPTSGIKRVDYGNAKIAQVLGRIGREVFDICVRVAKKANGQPKSNGNVHIG